MDTRQVMRDREELKKLLVQGVADVGEIQTLTHRAMQSGRHATRTDLERIKADADKLRSGLRSIAQTLGIEY